jgi:hypothetical protein
MTSQKIGTNYDAWSRSRECTVHLTSELITQYYENLYEDYSTESPSMNRQSLLINLYGDKSKYLQFATWSLIHTLISANR